MGEVDAVPHQHSRPDGVPRERDDLVWSELGVERSELCVA